MAYIVVAKFILIVSIWNSIVNAFTDYPAKYGGMALYLPLDEGTGLPQDKSGNNNTVSTCQARWDANGVSGSCLYFDPTGPGKKVEIADSSSLSNITDGVTIGGWLKQIANLDTTAGNDYREVFIKANWNYGIIFEQDGQICLNVHNTNNERYPFWTGYKLALDKWTHVIETYDSVTGKMCLYIDGKLQATKNFTPAKIRTSTGVVRFSANYWKNDAGPNTGQGNWPGYMDDLVIYNRALSAVEINAIYKNPGKIGLTNDATSGIIDLGYSSKHYSWLKYEGIISAGASITIYYRTSADSTTIESATWSEGFTESKHFLGEISKYFQYKIDFESISPETEAILQSVIIEPYPYHYLKLTPQGITKEGNLTIDIYFYEPMNTSINPTVKIQPENKAEITLTTGTWISNQNYRVSYNITSNTGDGFAKIKISGAKTAVDNYTMPEVIDEKSLIIDTSGIIATNKIEFFPDPFSPNNDGFCDTTRLINLPAITEPTKATVKIYNMKTRLVRILYDGDYIPGISSIPDFDGKDGGGNLLPIGLYIYQVDIGGQRATGTVTLVK